MKDKDLSVLLKKTDELRALFVLGQRVLPFLEEIFMFVSEIKPLLDDINHSIEENLKKMPNVSKQLSKVTEATELRISNGWPRSTAKNATIPYGCSKLLKKLLKRAATCAKFFHIWIIQLKALKLPTKKNTRKLINTTKIYSRAFATIRVR